MQKMMVCLNGLFDDGMLECLRLFSLKKHMISKIFRGGVLFDFNRIKGRYKSCRECTQWQRSYDGGEIQRNNMWAAY